jgi:diguanylate cyclase (GGDEF)-like protein/PAS domain S-box-containing protein
VTAEPNAPSIASRFASLDAVRDLLARQEDLPPGAIQAIQALSGELRRATEELSDADARYRAVVEQIPAIVYTDVVDDTMSTVYVSPQIEELLGILPEEYIADPDLWAKQLHPDDKEHALQSYLEGRTSGEPFSFEYRLLARDGRVVWFRDSAVVGNDRAGSPAYVHGVMFDITERKNAEEQVAFLAYHDNLTGLPNRTMFEELLELGMARARRHDLSVAVLCIDVDDFKLVNESLGYEAGDALLRAVAERLREATRETDLVARQGGDEFLLLLADIEGGSVPGFEGTDGAILVVESVAARVHESLRAPFNVAGTELYVSASIGISMFPHDADDASALLKNADAAMYQSRKTVPGSYVLHWRQSEEALGKLSLTTRLRKAVENRNWQLHYQPVVELAEGKMVGVEALIRWDDPNAGLVPPGDFIPLAEEMGLIEAIGDWVVEELSRQAAAWRAEGLELEVSFNLSPRQLWQPDLTGKILERLGAAELDPGSIIVEVTESTAMADPERTLRILRDLNGRGLRLALDDFGTGYSSFARLRYMPVDLLKIDRLFIRDVAKDAQAGDMVRAIIQLAHGLGMTPLAEGIETEDEWRFLVEQGCTLGQGFYFCRPAPAEDILARYLRSGFSLIGSAG